MQIKTIIAGLALAATGFSAMASDQTVPFDSITHSAYFTGQGTILDGGDDVISFDNLAAGTYNVTLSLNGQFVDFSGASLNGVNATVGQAGIFTWGYLVTSANAPLALTIDGTTLHGGVPQYSGQISVTPVPEPETLALMLAGLGAVGFIARRRKAA